MCKKIKKGTKVIKGTTFSGSKIIIWIKIMLEMKKYHERHICILYVIPEKKAVRIKKRKGRYGRKKEMKIRHDSYHQKPIVPLYGWSWRSDDFSICRSHESW